MRPAAVRRWLMLWMALSALSLPASLRAQQGNLLTLVPPSIDLSRQKTGDIALGYSALSGPRIHVGCLDFNIVFGAPVSTGVYRSVSAGTALVGVAGPGRMDFGGQRRNIAGITFHGSANWHYLYGGGGFPRRVLLLSVPVSLGRIAIIEGKRDRGALYNALAGVQAGAGLDLRAGGFLVTPSALASLLGGYVEKYDGGTYYSNLRSAMVRPFAVLSLGIDLLWPPGPLKISSAWQRSFSSGSDRAVSAVMLQMTAGLDFFSGGDN